MTEDWRTLAAAAAAGDLPARDRLVALSTDPARRVARRLVDDPDAVDDVVQDALIEMLATIGSLREPAAYLAWLALVVRKQADRHRRRLHPTMLLDLILEPAADGPDPAAAAERGEQVDRVRRALRLARDPDRRLLALRYYADWTDAELAELLGISRGAVRKRLYDARRRLQPLLADATDTTRGKDTDMTDVRALFGQVLDPATGPPAPAGAKLTPPTPGTALATGIKALDAMAPWPRGGVVDFLGPVGTGHLVILREILHNLLGHGRAALVAVASTEAADDGSRARLPRLVGIEPELPTLVVAAPQLQAHQALDYGARCASTLAAAGAQVLLAVDRQVSAAATGTTFTGRVGLTPAGGSVTGIRVAPHAPDADPTPAWETADAVTVTSLDELAAGRYPAIDLLASHSAVLPHTDPEHQRVAAECRRLLADAADLRAYLTQPFWVAEEHTGIPGETSTPHQTITELAQRVNH
jgi:RNA polymerase sigma factor (sigma-70 family)